MAASTTASVEWPVDASQYELIGKIGQGAFASVWGARTKEGQECAVKVLNLDHVDSNLSEIRREVQAMRLLSHPNVLTCHTAFVKETNLWLVTPIMRKGSALHSLQTARAALRERNQQPRMEDHILYILHETLLGLKYIHDNGQIHRDIKAGNILLDGNGEVRIADFGVSGWLEQAGSQQNKAKTFVGTPCFMAPEVIEQVHGYDFKADLWSLGITALELAKGTSPYAKYPPMKVLILTIQEDPPTLDSYDEEGDGDDGLDQVADEVWSNTFRNLVDMCLQKNPAKRPTCQEILNSKYLNSMNDEAKRAQRREACRTEVCDLVADVGTDAQAATAMHTLLPGNSPISIILSKEENRPAGTTWVFADGSQVLASSTTANATVDDVMNEIDRFGEHYERSATPPYRNTAEDRADVGYEFKEERGDDEDDLEQFMNDFELATGGENFRRGEAE